MKYSVMGFSQEKIMQLNNSGCNIDITDLAILSWLEKIANSPNTVKEVKENKVFFWVKYQALLDDMPILNIKKRMLYARLQKMVDAGILLHESKKAGGTYSFYAFSDVYNGLVFSEQRGQNIFDPVQNIADGLQKNAEGSAKNCREGLQKIAEQKNLLLNKPFTNKPNNNTTASGQESENDNDNDNDSTRTVREPYENRTEKSQSKKFVPPTVEQVRQYCQERKNGIDAEAFVDHYLSVGWKINKSPMKDWKAAVRTWERRNKNNGTGGNGNGNTPNRKPEVASQYKWL